MTLARDHHYLFSHVHLRNQALRGAEKVISELKKPMRDGFLFFLWEQVEGVAATKVSAAGLSVAGVDEIGGGTLALVQMPAPERDTESFFAAIFSGPSGARYYVFDRAVGDPSQGTLAELRLDETRINLGRHPATQQALLDALSAELDAPASSGSPSGGAFANVQLGSKPPAPSIGGAFGAPSSPPSGGAFGVPSSPPSGGAFGAPSSPPSGGAFGAPSSSGGAFANVQLGAPKSGGAFDVQLGSPKTSGGAFDVQLGSAKGPYGAPAGRTQAKKKAGLGCTLVALGVPLLCCFGIGAFAYDGGVGSDADFETAHHVSVDATDQEQLVLRMSGPEGFFSYRVEGPGAESCRYISRWGTGGNSCTVNLASVTEAHPTYRVSATGMGSSFLGFELSGPVIREHTVRVERTLGLAYSERAHGTVVRGFPGSLAITPDGFLRLTGAPAGTSLIVGSVSNADVEPQVALDLASLTDQVGVATVFRGGNRVSIQNVSVRLSDGTTANGTAQFEATALAPALAARLALLDQANLGNATGTSTLWLSDGVMQELQGTPNTLADVGRVIVMTNSDANAGDCGPYSSMWGGGVGSYVQRVRAVTNVVVFDRVENRRESSQTFRGPRPTCPSTISNSTDVIRGAPDSDAADAYARRALGDADQG
jgi:hypothetical protein